MLSTCQIFIILEHFRGEAEGRSSADILVDALDQVGSHRSPPPAVSAEMLLHQTSSSPSSPALGHASMLGSSPADTSGTDASTKALLPIVQVRDSPIVDEELC